MPAKMPKRKKSAKKAKKTLDMVSRKSRFPRIVTAKKRGRPGVRASEIAGRAGNYRNIFEQIWERLREPLLKSQTKDEITQAFEQFGQTYSREFVPHRSGLILKVLREPKFPKRPGPQIAFLADSLAGLGWITPRRSRDICERERKRPKHRIIRQDFYIECTCKYQGPALYGCCPKCGTGDVDWHNLHHGSPFVQNN